MQKNNQEHSAHLTIPTADSKIQSGERWTLGALGTILYPVLGIWPSVIGYFIGSSRDSKKDKVAALMGRKAVRPPSILNAGVAKGIFFTDVFASAGKIIGKAKGEAIGFLAGLAMTGYFAFQHKKDMQHDWDLAIALREKAQMAEPPQDEQSVQNYRQENEQLRAKLAEMEQRQWGDKIAATDRDAERTR